MRSKSSRLSYLPGFSWEFGNNNLCRQKNTAAESNHLKASCNAESQKHGWIEISAWSSGGQQLAICCGRIG